MQYSIPSLIILAAVGLVILWMGYRMRFKQDVELIAGMSRRKKEDIRDPEGLARLMGTSTIFMGLATLIAPPASMFWGQSAWMAYIGLVTGLGIVSVIKSKKFLD